jgi:hypothetical protein
MFNSYRGPVKKLVKKPNTTVLVNNSILQNITNPQRMPVNANNANTRRKKMLASLSAYSSVKKRGGKKSKKSKTRKSRK